MTNLLTNPKDLLEFITANRNSYFITLKTLPDFANWLESHVGATLQEKLRIFCDGGTVRPVCSADGCGNYTVLKDRSFFRGFQPFCCRKCAQSTASVRQKIVDTHRERFGSGSVRGSTEGGEAYNTTWLANEERNVARIQDAKDTREKTCLSRFGVKCVFSDPDIQQRAHRNANASMHSYKDFTSASGNVYSIRGYEGFAIDHLESQGLDFIADDFATPRISYEAHGVTRQYYPDIFVPSMNKIIEVKSAYWLAKQPVKNMAILEAAQAQGYEFEFWVFDGKTKEPFVVNTASSLKEFLQ